MSGRSGLLGVVGAVAGLVILGAGVLQAMGMLDGEPPALSLGAPDGPVRGDAAVDISLLDAAPGVGTVTVQVDDQVPQTLPYAEGTVLTWTLDTTALADGVHRVVVTARDRSLLENLTLAEAWVEVDNQSPQVEVAQRSLSAAQGEVLAVVIRADEALVDPRARLLEQDRPLLPVGDGVWRALFGVGVKHAPGAHTLTVTAGDAAGNTTTGAVAVEIAETAFRRGGYIKLSKRQKGARKDRAEIDKMRADRNAAYTWQQDVQRWEGAMLRPADGRRTSPFGQFRTYSDGAKKHHLGTDIANITGTPVQAANGGEVRAAGWQHLFGNAVIVHHGQGLTTSYNHLSRLDVEVGDRVEKGDVVGAIGSTGQSTGPHLHWGMQVELVEVDPERWPSDGFALHGFVDFVPLAAAR